MHGTSSDEIDREEDSSTGVSWDTDVVNAYTAMIGLKKSATIIYNNFNGSYVVPEKYDDVVSYMKTVKLWKDDPFKTSVTPQAFMALYALKLVGYDPCFAHLNRMILMCDWSTSSSNSSNAYKMLPFWLAYTLNGVGLFSRATAEGRWWLAMSISGMLSRVLGYAFTHDFDIPKGDTAKRIKWCEEHVEKSFRAVGLPTDWRASTTSANGGIVFRLGGNLNFSFTYLTDEMKRNLLTLPVAVPQSPAVGSSGSGNISVAGFEQ